MLFSHLKIVLLRRNFLLLLDIIRLLWVILKDLYLISKHDTTQEGVGRV